MKRPKIKDYFHEKTDLETVHSEYTKSPHLFSYASDLDRYIDYLEEQLATNEGESDKELLVSVSDFCECTYPRHKETWTDGIKTYCCHCRLEKQIKT